MKVIDAWIKAAPEGTSRNFVVAMRDGSMTAVATIRDMKTGECVPAKFGQSASTVEDAISSLDDALASEAGTLLSAQGRDQETEPPPATLSGDDYGIWGWSFTRGQDCFDDYENTRQDAIDEATAYAREDEADGFWLCEGSMDAEGYITPLNRGEWIELKKDGAS